MKNTKGWMLIATATFSLLSPAKGQFSMGIRVGEKAPSFALKDIKGKTYRLSDYRGKKVVLLDFGRCTCLPCRSVVQDLQKLHVKYAKKNVQIFTVNIDGPDAPKVVPKFIKTYGLTFPVIMDTTLKTAEAYQVFSIPFLVVVDKQGIVRYTHLGYDPDLPRILRNQFDKWLRR